jgi:hypothetical protein
MLWSPPFNSNLNFEDEVVSHIQKAPGKGRSSVMPRIKTILIILFVMFITEPFQDEIQSQSLAIVDLEWNPLDNTIAQLFSNGAVKVIDENEFVVFEQLVSLQCGGKSGTPNSGVSST